MAPQSSDAWTTTQILYLVIPTDRDLKDSSSYHGRLWSLVLDLFERSDGFQRLYWGRSLEQPENVQLHVVRPHMRYHEQFMKSPASNELKALLQTLASSGSTEPIKAIRYANLTEQTPGCQALGRGAPYTGSAIYLQPTDEWHEGAWPLWTHIVRHVDGCMGCAGGRMLEPIQLLNEPVLNPEAPVFCSRGDKWEGYIVYVGWESVEKHEAYHHTKHFAKHRMILGLGNVGFAEYGHVVFEDSRESRAGGTRL